MMKSWMACTMTETLVTRMMMTLTLTATYSSKNMTVTMTFNHSAARTHTWCTQPEMLIICKSFESLAAKVSVSRINKNV